MVLLWCNDSVVALDNKLDQQSGFCIIRSVGILVSSKHTFNSVLQQHRYELRVLLEELLSVEDVLVQGEEQGPKHLFVLVEVLRVDWEHPGHRRGDCFR